MIVQVNNLIYYYVEQEYEQFDRRNVYLQQSQTAQAPVQPLSGLSQTTGNFVKRKLFSAPLFYFCTANSVIDQNIAQFYFSHCKHPPGRCYLRSQTYYYCISLHPETRLGRPATECRVIDCRKLIQGVATRGNTIVSRRRSALSFTPLHTKPTEEQTSYNMKRLTVV